MVVGPQVVSGSVTAVVVLVVVARVVVVVVVVEVVEGAVRITVVLADHVDVEDDLLMAFFVLFFSWLTVSPSSENKLFKILKYFFFCDSVSDKM